MNPRILVFADWYLPGQQGGGVVRAVANLVDLLGDDLAFYILTRDRDHGSPSSYPGIPREEWLPVGKARVLYASAFQFGKLRSWICDVAPDIIYLNGFFSRLTIRTLLLRRTGLLCPVAFVLAPRGELGRAALGVKPFRKWAYLFAARKLGLLRGTVWQASSPDEEERIRTVAGSNSFVQIVRDVPDLSFFSALQAAGTRAKVSGAARFVFLSRISRNKNLDFALRVLASAGGQIEVDICGPVGDAAYWVECQKLLSRLPASVSVTYRGVVSLERVPTILREGHFLLLPTGGENFGYAILEALAAGCPVLTSDQTPWHGLETAGAGWELPLHGRRRWQAVLQSCIQMGPETYSVHSEQARRYASNWISSTPFGEEHLRLFREAVTSRPTSSASEQPIPTP